MSGPKGYVPRSPNVAATPLRSENERKLRLLLASCFCCHTALLAWEAPLMRTFRQSCSDAALLPHTDGGWSCPQQTPWMSSGAAAEEWRVPMRRPTRLARAPMAR